MWKIAYTLLTLFCKINNSSKGYLGQTDKVLCVSPITLPAGPTELIFFCSLLNICGWSLQQICIMLVSPPGEIMFTGSWRSERCKVMDWPETPRNSKGGLSIALIATSMRWFHEQKWFKSKSHHVIMIMHLWCLAGIKTLH